MGVAKRGQQGRHVNGVADGLVTRRVDDVAENLASVLDRTALGVAVAEKDQLLQPNQINIALVQSNKNGENLKEGRSAPAADQPKRPGHSAG